MAFIVVEKPDVNIWKENPALELIKEWREFKKKEGVERSSDILKAIYYIWDPKSELRDSGVDESQLIEEVTSSIINDPEFNWDDYDHIKDLYLKHNITKIQKLFLRYEKEIEDLNMILEDWKWERLNIQDKAAAVKQYRELFDQCIEIRDKVYMEIEDIKEMEGGYQKSLLEEYGG